MSGHGITALEPGPGPGLGPEPRSLPTIGLAQVPELLQRNDTKYVVPRATFEAFLDAMAPRLRILEVGGSTSFRYDSVYFDTPDLMSYHHHLQRRRKRFKVRTRTYLDSGESLLEVKLEGARGSTSKRRLPIRPDERTTLTPDGRAFVAGVLRDELGVEPPARLEPVLTTAYRRSTFVADGGTARYTCDTGLHFRGAGSSSGRAYGPEDHVLIEIKTAMPRDPAARVLHALGSRPVSSSKYAIAVALLWPAIRANPWRRTVRRYFRAGPDPTG